jgi:uncharacterized cysteine cluster protein YcgN (CxxCxxCC family)
MPFWTEKTLEEMTPEEWESLCDGCGRCCLVKLEDEDTADIYATDVACSLFDAETCRCKNYSQRASLVHDCVTLTPEEVRSLRWLPPSCGYRLVMEGKDLPDWHPLVSGSLDTVHQAGVSVRGRVFASEADVPLEDLPSRIKPWPLKWPKGTGPKGTGPHQTRAKGRAAGSKAKPV